jgi:hypothetical protein
MLYRGPLGMSNYERGLARFETRAGAQRPNMEAKSSERCSEGVAGAHLNALRSVQGLRSRPQKGYALLGSLFACCMCLPARQRTGCLN